MLDFSINVSFKIQIPQNSFKSRNVLHPADAAVAGPILKIAPGATHGERASRKLRYTLLGYIKMQQIVEFIILHSKNALEMISEDPNIKIKV